MLAFMLSAPRSLAEIRETVNALLAEQWEQTKRVDLEGMTPWSWSSTPLLPGAWPPDGSAVAFGFARRRKENDDVSRVSKP